MLKVKTMLLAKTGRITHIFASVLLTNLSLRAKSDKTDGNETLYEASYETPLTRKTML